MSSSKDFTLLKSYLDENYYIIRRCRQMLSAVMEIMHQGGTGEKGSSPKEVLY